MNSPKTKQKTESIAELIVTDLKVLNSRIDVRAGKIISEEISIEPISLMPSTIVIAVKTAVNILYTLVLIPVAFEKFSSKVIEKILL